MWKGLLGYSKRGEKICKRWFWYGAISRVSQMWFGWNLPSRTTEFYTVIFKKTKLHKLIDLFFSKMCVDKDGEVLTSVSIEDTAQADSMNCSKYQIIL